MRVRHTVTMNGNDLGAGQRSAIRVEAALGAQCTRVAYGDESTIKQTLLHRPVWGSFANQREEEENALLKI